MTATTEQGSGAHDIGRSPIEVREVTHSRPDLSPSGPGERGTCLFQLVIDSAAGPVRTGSRKLRTPSGH